jgi:glyoxylase-like metal-dependent hydrolase (beta-lactamase superfamily II)
MALEIITIDCQYLHPRFAASYLVKDSGKAFFVDNNTTHSVPLLLNALSRTGLKPEQVQYLVITHVHLDHAGGSSALMKACPNAVLLAHPRAVPHLIDPNRLVSSAKSVYGEDVFVSLYGEIEPIPAERVRAVQDEEVLPFGSTRLRFLFTRGHANHHICIQMGDEKNSVVFTGDSFGLVYPDLQTGGLFIFPSTSPTDFDAEEARKSIKRILNTGAQEVFPTHFGGLKTLDIAAEHLLKAIDLSENILNEAFMSSLPDEKLSDFCEERLRQQMTKNLEALGMDFSPIITQLLKLDIELNAAGLAHVAKKRRNSSLLKQV